ncbi:MAG: DUF4258 domain-containing protein [Candidatus Aminicenantes bacterium]|nr:DUF4258 domain-containing protein [Candidatus Aminicenantes bacterium]NIM81099.1 DUF4258 domain-containing protein [Candidatus Aminicenantes bacterium]NIN20473.1 DUF4258 domain-containing protein [Candidatus Aminicenantes bacterium]NIN44246.1 DUF4258 domain-containing protein [Candidatus Aminicenantes bacterium]NIN87065.1 DUF4258 domain-containing protein [Candidatus Aminicenantes bacterium]
MKRFEWNKEKSELLRKERGISFEEIINALKEGKLLDRYKHPNEERYCHQEIFVVEIKGNAYLVPFVEDEEKYFLKTIYRSRKATKKYIKEETTDEQQKKI